MMKKRRTKQQKKRAKAPDLNKPETLMAEMPLKSALIQDVRVIKNDLSKTLLISVVLVSLLIGIFMYLR
ncbi:MAG: hypothetical protein COU67_00575 [Candidatus Pacebacteria bacterium CG10_big_fil_rev_8_21_14_0_10_44_54]|nr:MAG: hypothetical protein COU67_00575 [Candidatus Pacebacteria bacterium CG10_big_fil_rev_8_21_14_0_10_44_54]